MLQIDHIRLRRYGINRELIFAEERLVDHILESFIFRTLVVVDAVQGRLGAVVLEGNAIGLVVGAYRCRGRRLDIGRVRYHQMQRVDRGDEGRQVSHCVVIEAFLRVGLTTPGVFLSVADRIFHAVTRSRYDFEVEYIRTVAGMERILFGREGLRIGSFYRIVLMVLLPGEGLVVKDRYRRIERVGRINRYIEVIDTIASLYGLELDILVSSVRDRYISVEDGIPFTERDRIRKLERRRVIDLNTPDTIHLARHSTAAEEGVETGFRDGLSVDLDLRARTERHRCPVGIARRDDEYET